jgi:hypothetical protein
MKVVSAHYINDYKVEVAFDDNKRHVINFFSELKANPVCKPYLDLSKFKAVIWFGEKTGK